MKWWDWTSAFDVPLNCHCNPADLTLTCPQIVTRQVYNYLR